jgi:acetylornithine deacetylase
MTVTQIAQEKQHNVECDLVVDIRVIATQSRNSTNRQRNIEVTPRSMNLSASSIPVTHGLVHRKNTYTLSLQTNRF